MRSLRYIPHLENIPVLVRAALNVPVENGRVTSTYRLRKAVPTINFLRREYARVILIGHIGDGGTETLAPVYEAMKAYVPGMRFCSSTVGPEARAAIRDLPPGGVLMLENLRRHAGEKSNDRAFALELAELADVFVQDSFDVCHRKHASVVGVPQHLAPYAGLQVEEEVRELTKALMPKRPSLAVIGGAKFSTKQPILEKLIAAYDTVFVGGALANDFMVERGYGVGTSLVSKDADRAALHALMEHPRLMLPLDEVVAPSGSHEDDVDEEAVALDKVPEDKAILDDGPKTIAALKEIARDAHTILWNGPLGNYEKGFEEGTEAFARIVAQSNAYSVIGGGDTVAAVEKLGLSEQFSFISTGGGAMLDFMAKGTLPGLDALNPRLG
ncbi:MAG TPA: phosphoglycerate kinase [Candidatus Paceibacterota bacterium]|jgi:phosphoglycerate kinase